MNLFINIIIDFILFSGIEGFIFCLFFEKIGKCRRFKWYEWLILSIGNCLISQLFPPVIYQVICIAWMIVFMYLTSNMKITKIITLAISFMLMFYIIEILYCILIENTILYDILLSENVLKNFVILLPTKLLEILISWKGESIMKLVAGGVVRK